MVSGIAHNYISIAHKYISLMCIDSAYVYSFFFSMLPLFTFIVIFLHYFPNIYQSAYKRQQLAAKNSLYMSMYLENKADSDDQPNKCSLGFFFEKKNNSSMWCKSSSKLYIH